MLAGARPRGVRRIAEALGPGLKRDVGGHHPQDRLAYIEGDDVTRLEARAVRLARG